ncbi:hypothetical protein LMB66_03835 [Limosilactobacillus reuteri]|uniref:hypothetical protein n=1 Tax=Limosilactobacillus reuteri TaxID=1598 RepID=UPI001E34E844|nr:hypothetical protein [Limosilactobacillus reuteri]MCC4374623.1 hypothetical protein [Limosilactobacillus reuteri]MCC4456031.1 hypothetical protein [Limosilactobacillus reuteri]MCC4464965.1 hypothetical protein [Limosilactobacillus reuteri]
MTPTARIVGLLSDNVANLEDILIDNICAYMIDEENVDNTHPILVVSEDNDGQRDMGNNTILSTIKRISIMFYYPINFDGDMDSIEKSVESFLYAHGIRRYLNAGHVMTPDTKNITNTLKFNYKQDEITEEDN